MIRIELAGVPAEIRCRYPQSEDFLRDYETDKEPLLYIEPTDEDLERIQANFDRMAEAEGNAPKRYSRRFLENNAIHALLAEALVQHNVLLMHGSALCMDGEGYIFTAVSGTGKSTHTRLWREAFGERVWMINDDKPLLRIESDGVTVYGTPWDGKHRLSRNASAPLKAIVLLTRSQTNHIEPLDRSRVFPEVYRQCYASAQPETMRRILQLEQTLLQHAECYRLGCNMEPDAALTAWRGMNPDTTR